MGKFINLEAVSVCSDEVLRVRKWIFYTIDRKTAETLDSHKRNAMTPEKFRETEGQSAIAVESQLAWFQLHAVSSLLPPCGFAIANWHEVSPPNVDAFPQNC